MIGESGASAQVIKRMIVIGTALLILAACSPAGETPSPVAATSGTEVLQPQEPPALSQPMDTAGRTYRVIEKFEQDGRFFVSVIAPPGDGGHLVQVEIKEKALWDAVRKEGFVTFGKAWQILEIEGKAVETFVRGDAE